MQCNVTHASYSMLMAQSLLVVVKLSTAYSVKILDFPAFGMAVSAGGIWRRCHCVIDELAS